mgnify:CR=1 FL=1
MNKFVAIFLSILFSIFLSCKTAPETYLNPISAVNSGLIEETDLDFSNSSPTEVDRNSIEIKETSPSESAEISNSVNEIEVLPKVIEENVPEIQDYVSEIVDTTELYMNSNNINNRIVQSVEESIVVNQQEEGTTINKIFQNFNTQNTQESESQSGIDHNIQFSEITNNSSQNSEPITKEQILAALQTKNVTEDSSSTIDGNISESVNSPFSIVLNEESITEKNSSTGNDNQLVKDELSISDRPENIEITKKELPVEVYFSDQIKEKTISNLSEVKTTLNNKTSSADQESDISWRTIKNFIKYLLPDHNTMTNKKILSKIKFVLVFVLVIIIILMLALFIFHKFQIKGKIGEKNTNKKHFSISTEKTNNSQYF